MNCLDKEIAITKIIKNKKQYLDLLLLGDEQESMIDRYLERGEMYVLFEGSLAAALCVITNEGNSVLEIKNIATATEHRLKGYGRALIDFIITKYAHTHNELIVGTGESPLTMPFYEKCGFVQSHRVKNFFTDNYDSPIFECGIKLVDMVYFKMKLSDEL